MLPLIIVTKLILTIPPSSVQPWLPAQSPQELFTIRRGVMATAEDGHATGFHARPHRHGAADVRARLRALLYVARVGSGALRVPPLIIVTKLVLTIPSSTMKSWMSA